MSYLSNENEIAVLFARSLIAARLFIVCTCKKIGDVKKYGKMDVKYF